MCPVRQWAAITQRVLSYPGTTSSSTVNTIINENGKLALIDSKMLLNKLRAAATAIGIDELGFITEDIGLHSLRSGAAMAMYLSSIPVFTIMLIGRWSSDAFLRYIRKQVQEFSAGVNRKMLTADVFFTIPEAQHEDPRVSGNLHNFAARKKCGRDANDAARPRFALWA